MIGLSCACFIFLPKDSLKQSLRIRLILQYLHGLMRDHDQHFHVLLSRHPGLFPGSDYGVLLAGYAEDGPGLFGGGMRGWAWVFGKGLPSMAMISVRLCHFVEDRPIQCLRQILHLHRLGQVVVHARFKKFFPVPEHGIGGQGNDRDVFCGPKGG
jgi:hypothetical protein